MIVKLHAKLLDFWTASKTECCLTEESSHLTPALYSYPTEAQGDFQPPTTPELTCTKVAVYLVSTQLPRTNKRCLLSPSDYFWNNKRLSHRYTATICPAYNST